MELKEEWKDIQGYNGYYQVSNLGRVKSLSRNKWCSKKTSKEILMKTRIGNNGYKKVGLSINSKQKTVSVHKLVAQAFIPNPNNYPVINHKDENPLNNRADNLEWCTYSYNSSYGTYQERRVKNTNFKERSKNIDYKYIGECTAKKLSKKVYQYDKNMKLIKIWESSYEPQKQGFNQSLVTRCCVGRGKTHKGFLWSHEYKEQFNN